MSLNLFSKEVNGFIYLAQMKEDLNLIVLKSYCQVVSIF